MKQKKKKYLLVNIMHMETNQILLEILQTLKQIEKNTRPKIKKAKKEVVENQQIGLEIIPEDKPKTYGNKDINLILSALKQTIGIDDFRETKQNQRNYGNHFKNLIAKIGREEFRRRLNQIMDDDFKRKNCNSLKYLYGEIKSCLPEKMINRPIAKFTL